MDQMTVTEHLEFYARVRGVQDVDHNVREVIRAIGLTPFADRMAAKLSGGNKRKLSLGIALIGNPTVLLLDEPSSGMDAAAKRLLWATLAAVAPGRSLLLTTHSMEEASALADRAGIMAKRMLAMDTSAGLRKRFGGKYYVHLVLKSAPHTTDDETASLKDWVVETFPGAELEDKTYHGQIRFSVPVESSGNEDNEKTETTSSSSDDDDGSAEMISGGSKPGRNHGEAAAGQGGDSGIGSIITLLEDKREELGLEHYSVSPTTLDQVFLTIVGKHNVEEEGYSDPKHKGNWWKKLVGK
jgi:ABC-type multidrug transport system ATPase subunit